MPLHTVPSIITSIIPRQSVVVNITDSVTIECIATGLPMPLIKWYQGDTLLSNGSEMADSQFNMSNTVYSSSSSEVPTVSSTLSFSVTSVGFASNYTCLATNMLGSTEGHDEEEIILTVQGMLHE